jgi:hypothetical protein
MHCENGQFGEYLLLGMWHRFISGVDNLSGRFPQEQKAIAIVLNGNASEFNGILVD